MATTTTTATTAPTSSAQTSPRAAAGASAIAQLPPAAARFATALGELQQLQALQVIAANRQPAAYPMKVRPIRVKGGARDYIHTGLAVDKWLKAMPADRRQKLLGQFEIDTQLTPGLQAAMQQMKIDLKSPVPVMEQADLRVRFGFLDAAAVQTIARARAFDERGSGAASATSRAAVVNGGLKFRINQLKCNDETTTTEWVGKDNMAVGGSASDDKNQVSEIPMLVVGDFNDGSVKTYDPPRVLKTFDLSGSYPKTFTVFMALAERDSGGFATFISDMVSAVEDEIDAVTLAAGVAAGAAIGGVVGGPVGALVGAVGCALVSGIIGLIGGIANDEVFQPQMSSVLLESPDDTFAGGSLVSKDHWWTYEQYSGKYTLRYSWAITR